MLSRKRGGFILLQVKLCSAGRIYESTGRNLDHFARRGLTAPGRINRAPPAIGFSLGDRPLPIGWIRPPWPKLGFNDERLPTAPHQREQGWHWRWRLELAVGLVGGPIGIDYWGRWAPARFKEMFNRSRAPLCHELKCIRAAPNLFETLPCSAISLLDKVDTKLPPAAIAAAIAEPAMAHD